MNTFLAFLLSLFSLGSHPPSTPTPTPIIFHPYPPSSLSVNWGAPGPDHTIFIVANMLPGDSEFREITITNHNSSPRPLSLRSTKTAEEKAFSQILDITLFKDGNVIYGPVKLAQFFLNSATPSGIPLGNLAGNSTSTYKFLVDFPSSAGNEYQLAKVVFDLKIGKRLKIPARCRRFQGDDHNFTVTSQNSEVFATFDCQDKIDDSNPDSCYAHP